MMSEIIKIVRDFHPFPAGRYIEDGPGNGTTFREQFLIPILKGDEEVTIDLDGAPGYPSSFLEEAFGGLIRRDIAADLIRSRIKLKATDPGFQRYIDKIWDHIDRAVAVKRAVS